MPTPTNASSQFVGQRFYCTTLRGSLSFLGLGVIMIAKTKKQKQKRQKTNGKNDNGTVHLAPQTCPIVDQSLVTH